MHSGISPKVTWTGAEIRSTINGYFFVVFSKGTQDEMELDALRTARSRYHHAGFSSDFGIHRDSATTDRL
jgi:hypothetical protein